ncbi:hypothetical protein Bca4012_063415 [Brassica carinata]
MRGRDVSLCTWLLVAYIKGPRPEIKSFIHLSVPEGNIVREREKERGGVSGQEQGRLCLFSGESGRLEKDLRSRMGGSGKDKNVENPKTCSKVCDGSAIHLRLAAPMVESMVWSVRWFHPFSLIYFDSIFFFSFWLHTNGCDGWDQGLRPKAVRSHPIRNLDHGSICGQSGSFQQWGVGLNGWNVPKGTNCKEA